jgi:outer membrane protein OmpA-like peptidoglycan-associated protein
LGEPNAAECGPTDRDPERHHPNNPQGGNVNKSGPILLLTIAVPLSLALATSGCASKKFVRQQVAPVNERVSKLQTQTNDQISAVRNKHNADISEVHERISTTDQKLAQVAGVADQAQGTASRAMEQTQTNASAIQSNSTQISTLATGVANALNYQLIVKGDVTFGFNKSTLTPDAKVALDAMAAKALSLPRSVIELTGFTDKVGSETYNLALSRRRAEAVQRYLVLQKVPPRAIHIVGLGEEAPPEGLEVLESNPNASRRDIQRLARRVRINVYGAGDITEGTASRSEQ